MDMCWIKCHYLAILSYFIFIFGFTGWLSVSAKEADTIVSPETLRHLISTGNRAVRSIEGASCRPAPGPSQTVYGTTTNQDTCIADNLEYTQCNPNTLKCECDSRVSVRLAILPGASICLPLIYVNITGNCYPTNPDMCSVVSSGSACQVLQAGGQRQMKCACRTGPGTFPNCTPRLGGPCHNTTSCANQIANSYCANQALTGTYGFGSCLCPAANVSLGVQTGATLGLLSALTYVPNSRLSQCLPSSCPTIPPAPTTVGPTAIWPCNGDVNSTNCQNTTSGFQCGCTTGAKGQSHNLTSNGRCCDSSKLVCSDYSKCILVTDLCNGVVDCNDCSDETWSFCTGPWPGPQYAQTCGPPRRIASITGYYEQLQMSPVRSASNKLEDPPSNSLPTQSSDNPNPMLNFDLFNGQTFKDFKVVGPKPKQ